MRPMLFALAVLVASGPVAAQSWEEYSYSDYAISLASSANPQIEMTSYQVAEGRSVPARAWRMSGSILLEHGVIVSEFN